MPSVVRLWEQRELTARCRVDGLREEADRINTEPAVAEREWNEWAIARSHTGEVLARAATMPTALMPPRIRRVAVNCRRRPGPRRRREVPQRCGRLPDTA